MNRSKSLPIVFIWFLMFAGVLFLRKIELDKNAESDSAKHSSKEKQSLELAKLTRADEFDEAASTASQEDDALEGAAGVGSESDLAKDASLSADAKTKTGDSVDTESKGARSLLSNVTQASTVKKVYKDILQSPARPLGLDIYDKVKAGEYDSASANFVENALPAIDDFLNDVFQEGAKIAEASPDLSLSDLMLREDANVRVYFVKEGAVFHNSLGIEMAGEQQLIFPDASSADSYHKDKESRVEETNEDLPLLPGDFVDLGRIEQGTLMDLFMIKNGARNENGKIFWANEEDDSGQFSNIKLHGVYDETTLVIGFEDIPGGGDKDFDDLVIAVEIQYVE